MQFRRISVAALLLTVIATNGCGTLTVQMDTVPTLKGGSPLRGIEPVTFQIDDLEDQTEKILALVRAAPTTVVRIDRPASEIVKRAIIAELERNGHRVVTSGASQTPDVRLGGAVTKLLMRERPQMMGLLGYEYDVYAEMHISVSRASNNNNSLADVYSGTAECGQILTPNPKIFGDDESEACIAQALANMVKDFTTAPEVLKMLRSIKATSVTGRGVCQVPSDHLAPDRERAERCRSPA